MDFVSMVLLYRVLNSVICLLLNFCIALYMCQRVNESCQSLVYVSENVDRDMDEIQDDLAKELQVTHNVTHFKTELAGILQRFSELESVALEWIRISPNMKSIVIGTPININEDVKKIMSLRRKIQNPGSQKTTEQLKSVLTTFHEPKSANVNNSFSKFFTVASNHFVSGDQPKELFSRMNRHSQKKGVINAANSEKRDIVGRTRTPIYPEVELLSEQKQNKTEVE